MKFVFVFLLGLALGGSPLTQADAGDDLIAKLQKFDSLAGQFTQTIVDAKGDLLEESSGNFVFKKPGKVRWENTLPYAQLLITDGTTLWLYDPDLEQVTIAKVGDKIANTPALLMQGDYEALRENYRIELGKADDAKKIDTLFVLTPTHEGNEFSSLKLGYKGDKIQQMVMGDRLGQITYINLNVDEKAQAPTAEIFEFKVPEGTEVIIEGEQ